MIVCWVSWWRHQMETFSELLAICAGKKLMFSLICAWINGWVNNREAGDLRRHRGHYDVTVMLNWVIRQFIILSWLMIKWNYFVRTVSTTRNQKSKPQMVTWWLDAGDKGQSFRDQAEIETRVKLNDEMLFKDQNWSYLSLAVHYWIEVFRLYYFN